MDLVSRKENSRSALVQLAEKVPQKEAAKMVAEQLALIHTDPHLPADEAVQGLLATLGHIILRYKQYGTYPTLLYKLSKHHNPAGYIASIQDFLTMSADELDYGYGYWLQKEALDHGSEAAAADYLLSHEIQEELKGLFRAAQATSLDVERRHAADKRSAERLGPSVRNSQTLIAMSLNDLG
eukprot:6458436-Amphidinium_carterae.2